MLLSNLIVLVLAILFGVVYLISLLVGLAKGWKKMTIRLAVVIVTAVAAVLLTVLVTNVLKSPILEVLKSAMTEEVVAQILNASPSLAEYAYGIASALLSPIIFLLLFFAVWIVLKIVVNTVLRFFKNWKNALVGLIVFVLAIVLAVVGYNILVNANLDFISQITDSIVSGLKSIPNIDESACSNVAKGIVATICILLLFVVIRLILKIPAAFIKHAINKKSKKHDEIYDETNEDGERPAKKKKKRGVVDKLVGGALGLVSSFLILCCVFMPLIGYADFASSIYVGVEEMGVVADNDTASGVANQVSIAMTNPFVKFHKLGIDPLFDNVAAVRTGNGQSPISKQKDTILKIASSAQKLSQSDFSDFTNINLAPINEILDELDDLPEIEASLAEILNEASKKWINGEEFLGVNLKEQVGSDLSFAVDILLEDFTTTTSSRLKTDLGSLTSLYGDFIDIYKNITKIDFSDMSNIDMTPINSSVDIAENSVKLKKLLSSALSTACTKWSNGEEFMQTNILSSVPSDFQNAVKVLLDDLKVVTEDTVCDELRSFADTIGSIGEIYTSISSIDFNDIDSFDMTAFDELIVKVDKNETLKKVVATVLNDAGNAWGGNPPTAFMGINIKESLPDEYKNMFDSSIESFKTTTKDTVTRDLTSFSNTLKSYKNAIKYAKTLTTEGSTMEELQSDMTDFLCSLTEDSVEVIKESFTDDMLTKAGVTEENTEAVKEVVNSALDEVTKMDEEQRVQEAEALNTVIAYVTNHQTTNESEESEKTVSDEEAVDAIVGSEMISGIICDMAESDWTITSTESEKEQISAALEKYEDSEDEDEKKTVEAIKKLFGITSDEEE